MRGRREGAPSPYIEGPLLLVLDVKVIIYRDLSILASMLLERGGWRGAGGEVQEMGG